MFQLGSIFNCDFCQKLLENPISLPCGETVCKSHTKEITQAKCIFCSDNHQVPQNGFPANKMVQKQLDLNLNKINQNFSQFNDYKRIIEDLNKKLREIEVMHKDPDNYIYEYFNELIRQVDVRRDTLFEGIQKYSETVIEGIEKLKADCMAKAKKATRNTKNIDEIKAKLTTVNSMFNSLEMSDTKHEEIMTQKRSKEIGELIRPVLEQFKLELQGYKKYKLKTVQVEIKNVFGSLDCEDIVNIQNIKVNIYLFINSNIFKVPSSIDLIEN